MAVVKIKSDIMKKLLFVIILLVILSFVGLSFRRFHVRKSYRITLSVKDSPSNIQNKDCAFHTCFEVSLCSLSRRDKIGVYVYDEPLFVDSNGNELNLPYSVEYKQLIQAVKSSSYYQSNISKACVFIPPIDTLSQLRLNTAEVSRSLSSLPDWEDGSNHLIINMLPGASPDYNMTIDIAYGKAILAGGGFTENSYRRDFDVSIPVYDSMTRLAHTKPSSKASRKHLLTIFRRRHHLPVLIEILEKLSQEEQVISLHSCSKGLLAADQSAMLHQCFGNKVVNYPTILQQSRYCLIAHELRYGTYQLLDAMMSDGKRLPHLIITATESRQFTHNIIKGCIPVIVVDGYVLPFSEVLDWSRASIRVHPHDVHKLFDILEKISDEQETELREQAMFLWETYFSSMEQIAITILDIINDRIFPHLARSYESWNNNPLDALNPAKFQYSFLRLPLPAPDPSQGFTAVILTYDRVDMLYQVIRGVAKAPSLAKILIVWNNVDKSPPPSSEWPAINKPVELIQSKENKLSNRFYPYSEITTDCVLSIDDDIIMLTPDELEFGYTWYAGRPVMMLTGATNISDTGNSWRLYNGCHGVWTEYPEHLVGFPGRVHFWSDEEKTWKYNSEWTNNISIVLTGAAFYHKFYNHLYTHHLPKPLKHWVDKNMNCEDIAMNFVIANYTGKAPIKVTPRKKFKCADCSPVGSLWSDPNHFLERHECLKVFTRVYGNMPLKSVQFRADPVLFKDEFSTVPKKFSDMGNL